MKYQRWKNAASSKPYEKHRVIVSLPTVAVVTHTDEREYNKKRDRQNRKPSCLLIGTFFASIVAAGGAVYSAKETDRQATAAEKQLAEAKIQTEIAKRGAPRAWLYVEADVVSGDTGEVQQGVTGPVKNYFYRGSFSITNYGQIPGTVIEVSAHLIIFYGSFFDHSTIVSDINNVSAPFRTAENTIPFLCKNPTIPKDGKCTDNVLDFSFFKSSCSGLYFSHDRTESIEDSCKIQRPFREQL